MTTRDIVGAKAVSAPFQSRFNKAKGPEDENEPGNVTCYGDKGFVGTYSWEFHGIALLG